MHLGSQFTSSCRKNSRSHVTSTTAIDPDNTLGNLICIAKPSKRVLTTRCILHGHLVGIVAGIS
jgi:hypothetical protein